MPRLIKTLQHYPISRDGDSGTSLTLNKITKILNLGCRNVWQILQHPCMCKYPSYQWMKSRWILLMSNASKNSKKGTFPNHLGLTFFWECQYFTLPHMFHRNPPDSLDSSGLDRIPEMSHIVTRWFRRSPLESAGINKNKVDCSPEKGVRWSPPESTGLEWELIPRYKLPYLGGAPLT